MPAMRNKRRKTADPVSVYVGRKLREVRMARGLSCAWTAHCVGMSPNAYSGLERGRNRIRLDSLFSILAVLGAETEDVWPPDDWIHPDWPFGPR